MGELHSSVGDRYRQNVRTAGARLSPSRFLIADMTLIVSWHEGLHQTRYATVGEPYLDHVIADE